jgi:hypothetical protein
VSGDGDPIRAVLAGLAAQPRPGESPSGEVEIPVSLVEEAGADLDVVTRWVEARGGARRQEERYVSKSVGRDGPVSSRRATATRDYYAIPSAALRAPGTT